MTVIPIDRDFCFLFSLSITFFVCLFFPGKRCVQPTCSEVSGEMVFVCVHVNVSMPAGKTADVHTPSRLPVDWDAGIKACPLQATATLPAWSDEA